MGYLKECLTHKSITIYCSVEQDKSLEDSLRTAAVWLSNEPAAWFGDPFHTPSTLSHSFHPGISLVTLLQKVIVINSSCFFLFQTCLHFGLHTLYKDE